MGLLGALRQRRASRLASGLVHWTALEEHGSGHVVQFYGGEFPAASVAGFLKEGVATGEVGLVIATPEHIAAIDQELGDLRAKVVYLDAEGTLESFMHHGAPDRQRFFDLVGDLVQQAAVTGNSKVRAFGEMVVLLCQRGEPRAAAELEELWNELGQRHSLRLLCAYPAHTVQGRNRPFQDRLREAHSHALPL